MARTHEDYTIDRYLPQREDKFDTFAVENKYHDVEKRELTERADKMLKDGASRDEVIEMMSSRNREVHNTTLSYHTSDDDDRAERVAEYKGRQTGSQEAIEDFIASANEASAAL